MKRSFIRGGGAIGGGIFRIVDEEESSREGGGGRRSVEGFPCRILPRVARAGIFDGLFIPDDIETELASGFRDMLAPKLDTLAPKLLEEDTGVLDRLGGAPPRTVLGRLSEPDLECCSCLVGIPVFDGVFARGGGADAAAAYNSSR